MTLKTRTLAATLMIASLVAAYRLGLQAAADEGPGLRFTGDVALWTVAIKPDRTAEYEKVLMRVRDALQQSDDPQRKEQMAGWRVMKVAEPLPEGNIAYVHVITPVVPGADYTLLKSIYDQFPSESQSMYDLYRGAFAKNLSVAAGSWVIDMSTPPEPGVGTLPAPATPPAPGFGTVPAPTQP
jgi:hypothetical protein